jgi:peptidoglycan/LPS O-acetylase OafA/YrhL
MTINENKEFAVSDTLFCKGLAICMVLIHHLFYTTMDYGVITYQIALISQVGVSIFVFLSGFGLFRSYTNRGEAGIMKYYFLRLKKLYVPYWFVWVLFVPFTVIFFNRSFASVYGSNIMERLIENILGVHILFDFWGYNPTWWFVSLIIGLYVLSPVIFYIIEKQHIFAVIYSVLIFRMPPLFLTLYLFSFVLGAYVSSERIIENVANIMRSHFVLKLIVYISILFLLIWQRQFGIFKSMAPSDSSSIDAILSLLIIVICFEYFKQIKLLKILFTFTGKHAYNIFLIHTFFLTIYLGNFIYSFDYVPLIFIVLLIISLIASSALNWIITLSGINKGYNQKVCK